MSTNILFSPTRIGKIAIDNRVLMPPMTRCRSAQPGDIPTDLMATYYAQRASAGYAVPRLHVGLTGQPCTTCS